MPCAPKDSTHSLLRGEKFTARRSGKTALDPARKRSTRRLRCDRNFDARPAWTTPPDFQRGNRRDACREGENSMHSPPERREAGEQAQDSTHRPRDIW
ncbi:hypothetical protein NDU88_006865 [Pleurodeles waltl]|uniref:Uncharacterized protein n=1 Tax=Pleurodeles waltl TaxID=8319 RepID=A0AAV7QL83_PLEWA|nr:hypothetical protein NDU88_006865 [Pleurodeles waltl]